MRLKTILATFAFLLWASGAPATQAINTTMPDAAVVGRGTLSYIFWDVYEATLYAPRGQWRPGQPTALAIEYYHAIDGADIADRSVQEIRQQGFSDEVKLAAWHAQLRRIFPDVANGTILTAIYTPGEQTAFYNGNAFIGSIKGDEFGRLFFGIWLSEQTSAPSLRRALLSL